MKRYLMANAILSVPDEFLNENKKFLTLSIFDNSGKLIQQKKNWK